jgi:hypothetical protein
MPSGTVIVAGIRERFKLLLITMAYACFGKRDHEPEWIDTRILLSQVGRLEAARVADVDVRCRQRSLPNSEQVQVNFTKVLAMQTRSC